MPPRMVIALLFMVLSAVAQVPPVEMPMEQALLGKTVSATFAGNGRESAQIHLKNLSATAVKLKLPAGVVLESPAGERQVTIRALVAEVAANGEADAIVPTAALSAKNTGTQRPLELRPALPQLAPLIAQFDKLNDLPRATAQAAVLIFVEDIPWAGWKAWMAPVWNAERPPKQHPTPTEVAQAVDAAAYVKLLDPARKITLLEDEEFKRLALRNTWARGKAMALYGMAVEDAITGEASAPPDLGKLLHTSPNDNCPICRQRDQMQKAPDF